MKRISTRIGDVFVVKLDEQHKKYLQYVANDSSDLGSDVVRAFEKLYAINENPSLSEIVRGEVQFYAHCVSKWGIKLGFWEKIGNASFDQVTVWFRDSGDDPQIKVSNNWWVWRINEERKKVGELKGKYQHAEIGTVIPPDSIVHRMRTGKYDFVYPDFEKK
jgi:hypothetical protein